MDAGISVVAGIDVAAGIVGEAEDECSADLGELLEIPAVYGASIDLPIFSAGIDPPVRPPGDRLGMVEKRPKIGEGQDVPLLFRHDTLRPVAAA